MARKEIDPSLIAERSDYDTEAPTARGAGLMSKAPEYYTKYVERMSVPGSKEYKQYIASKKIEIQESEELKAMLLD